MDKHERAMDAWDRWKQKWDDIAAEHEETKEPPSVILARRRRDGVDARDSDGESVLSEDGLGGSCCGRGDRDRMVDIRGTWQEAAKTMVETHQNWGHSREEIERWIGPVGDEKGEEHDWY